MKAKEKAFLEYLSYLSQKSDKAKQYKKDKRLTLLEKKVLDGWILIRKSDYAGLNELLKSMTTKGTRVVEAQKNLLKGVYHNNFGELKKAQEYLLDSAVILEEYDLGEFLFIANYNLYISYVNSHQIEKMKNLISKIVEFDSVDKMSIYYKYQCEFELNIALENYNICEQIRKKVYLRFKKLPASFKSSFLISDFIYNCSLESFLECRVILSKMNEMRSFKNTSNYLFMKTIIDFILDEKPIYAYEYKFKNSKFLYFQLKFLEALVYDDDLAKSKFWNKLVEIDERVFSKNFTYNGSKDLFSYIYEKYSKDNKSKKLNADTSLIFKTNLEALEFLFEKYNKSFSKEEIFEFVWKRKIQTQGDLTKIKNLISQYRKKHVLVYNKGFYSSSKKAS
ncbi:MAG: hypothetical protein N4A33_08520 [Bacteriovoracaceae bacterium]|jgi:hypothetical protein|nr:hypothetical protein [Bacteriovoracaceae bacterium]